MFPTLPPFTETITPATTTVVGVIPDVGDLTLGVIDLSDTGFVTEDPAVLVWLATVSESGLAWTP